MRKSLSLIATIGLAVAIPRVVLPHSLGDVAGEYDTGIGLSGDVLRLSTDGTFTFAEVSDVGDDQYRGTYEIEGMRIRLRLEATGASTASRAPTDLLIVPWGERTYLLRPTQRIDFCNCINRGLEPRESKWMSLFLLREGEYRVSVTGLPDLPVDWRSCILDSPITAEVLEVDGATARVSAGCEVQAYPGLELEVFDPTGEWLCSAVVTSCEPRSSLVSIEEGCGPVKVGSVVTSRFGEASPSKEKGAEKDAGHMNHGF